MRVPGQTLLLASELSKTIHKFGFLFLKPPAETRIVCITTAANVYDEKPWLENEKQAFQSMGFTLDNFDIAGQPSAAVTNRLAEADVIYVTGGNTYYLMEQVNKSGFATALRTALARGALYIGASAGAVIAGTNIDFIRTMDDAAAANLTDFSGMGLIDLLVLPHLDHRDMGAVARAIAAEKRDTDTVLALCDDQALLVRDAWLQVY